MINTEKLKSKFEKEDLLEICYVYSKFLNEKYEDKEFQVALKNLSIGLEEKLMTHHDKFNIDVKIIKKLVFYFYIGSIVSAIVFNKK